MHPPIRILAYTQLRHQWNSSRLTRLRCYWASGARFSLRVLLENRVDTYRQRQGPPEVLVDSLHSRQGAPAGDWILCASTRFLCCCCCRWHAILFSHQHHHLERARRGLAHAVAQDVRDLPDKYVELATTTTGSRLLKGAVGGRSIAYNHAESEHGSRILQQV